MFIQADLEHGYLSASPSMLDKVNRVIFCDLRILRRIIESE
ncbi:unnamed protein product [Moneuplotes crassus]|uniref:Uncharacterized protein n=1 Tax=Euplotes crassus TaxID=5936 RepID=A0AAD2D743_EUPCR|nr:unnamed protein product [Moneuplotes crassus]